MQVLNKELVFMGHLYFIEGLDQHNLKSLQYRMRGNQNQHI